MWCVTRQKKKRPHHGLFKRIFFYSITQYQFRFLLHHNKRRREVQQSNNVRHWFLSFILFNSSTVLYNKVECCSKLSYNVDYSDLFEQKLDSRKIGEVSFSSCMVNVVIIIRDACVSSDHKTAQNVFSHPVAYLAIIAPKAMQRIFFEKLAPNLNSSAW